MASTVLVGRSMGEGKPQKALLYYRLINAFNFVTLLIVSTLMLVYSRNLASIFTSQIDLLNLTDEKMKYIALFILIHGMVGTISGSLRGIGK